MKKTKPNIVLIISILLIVIFLMSNFSNIIDYTVMQIARRLEEPIDLETFIINNNYFGISSNGEKAENTTKGINEAIEYASKHNIEYIKFERGTYSITGITTTKMETAGIITKSNVKIDLNQSIIKQEKNNSIAYICISIQDCNNVEVCNGIIIGDKKEHEYVPNSENQWGHGVYIKNANGIMLNNLEIYNAIGDGICISGEFVNEANTTNNITIKNCNIHDNRRQGISVGSGNKINIYNNEIYDIGGSPPHTGIDLEPNGGWQRVSNVIIQGNKIYNTKSNRAVSINAYVKNVDIIENEMNGGIYANYIEDYISIANNIMKNGSIYLEYREQYIMNRVLIKNNELDNITINVEGCDYIEVDSNTIKGKKDIQLLSSNCTIKNNRIEGNENKQIILGVRDDDIGDNKYTAKIYDNKLNNQDIEVIVENEDRYTIVNN